MARVSNTQSPLGPVQIGYYDKGNAHCVNTRTRTNWVTMIMELGYYDKGNAHSLNTGTRTNWVTMIMEMLIV